MVKREIRIFHRIKHSRRARCHLPEQPFLVQSLVIMSAVLRKGYEEISLENFVGERFRIGIGKRVWNTHVYIRFEWTSLFWIRLEHVNPCRTVEKRILKLLWIKFTSCFKMCSVVERIWFVKELKVLIKPKTESYRAVKYFIFVSVKFGEMFLRTVLFEKLYRQVLLKYCLVLWF